MHQRLPNSLVIWYDSVTSSGDVSYQNELNSQNRIFFDSCDGIFLNYGWNEANLRSSAVAAGKDRQTDVYVGVDVFGRGVFGGGGYNCNKAFKVIRKEKLSAALFAPGWVLETQGSEHFFEHQDKFWDLLAPFCPEHAVVREIPLVTSLCRGCGQTASIDGKVVLSHPWTHLSAQQCQPTFSSTFSNLGPGLTINSVKHTMEEAYTGGSCLLINGHTNSGKEVSKSFVRLYKTDFQITGPLLVSVTFKLNPEHCLDVTLQLQLPSDKVTECLLLLPATSDQQGSSDTEDANLNDMLIRRYGIPKSRTLTSSAFASPIDGDRCKMFESLTGDSHTVVQQAQGLMDGGAATWCTRHYLIAEKDLVGHTVQEIRLVCSVSPGTDSTGPFKLYLGEIKIVDPQVVQQPLASVRNIRSLDVVWKSSDKEHLLSLTLMWDRPITDGQVDIPAHYNIFQVTQDTSIFLGRAFVEAYRVCQIPVSKTSSSVEFVVQIVTRSGLKKPLGDCSHFKLSW